MSMRSMFWRDSKLAELGPQPLPSFSPTPTAAQPIASLKYPRRSKPAQLMVMPIPSFAAPLSHQDLLTQVVEPALRGESVNLSCEALVPSPEAGRTVVQTVPLSYAVDGLMLLVKSASVSAERV